MLQHDLRHQDFDAPRLDNRRLEEAAPAVPARQQPRPTRGADAAHEHEEDAGADEHGVARVVHEPFVPALHQVEDGVDAASCERCVRHRQKPHADKRRLARERVVPLRRLDHVLKGAGAGGAGSARLGLEQLLEAFLVQEPIPAETGAPPRRRLRLAADVALCHL